MTDFLDNPQTGKIVKLSGQIVGYCCTRSSASFVFTDGDRQKMGVVAVAAALAGMGGQAASVAGYASDMEEIAEFIEFNLDGAPVKGWVWRSPFKEGDAVEVAAEWLGDHYEAYGIARPADRMIALYPHCSRSRGRHIKNCVKWWAIGNRTFFGPTAAWFFYMGGSKIFLQPAILWMSGGLAAFFIVMSVSITRKLMPFVRLAQRVFNALSLPNAVNLDLVQSSKQQRTEHDAAEFGTFYFRY